MKILLVSWSVLPYPGGSSVIIENLARHFRREELIVLGASTLFQSNKLDRNPELAEFRYFFSEMYLFGRGYRYFTWFRKWRFQPLIRHIKELIQREKIDYVIGVYPNPFYCLAACRAARSMGIPFSSYFHNTYLDNKAINNPEAANIQAEIFDCSRHIFVMSEGMQRFYEEQYQMQKFMPLVHTFNRFPKPEELSGVPGEGKALYRLVAIGNFNESNLDATRRFINAITHQPKYELSLYTHVPKLLLQKRNIDTSRITHMGSVAPDKVHAALQQYDICVLTHGFTGGYGQVEYRTIFPTRTIPLLLSGKPILAHSPRGSFLNDFIGETQCAELVEKADEAVIISGLERITNSEAYQLELVGHARKAAEKFYGKNVAQGLKNTLKHEADLQ